MLPSHQSTSFSQIVEAVTARPAKAIGRQDQLGSLGLSREADITMFKIVPGCNLIVADSFGVTRTIDKMIVPVAVWRSGHRFPISPRPHDHPTPTQ